MLLVERRFALEFPQAPPRADLLLLLKSEIDVLIVPPRHRRASHESPGLGHSCFRLAETSILAPNGDGGPSHR